MNLVQQEWRKRGRGEGVGAYLQKDAGGGGVDAGGHGNRCSLAEGACADTRAAGGACGRRTHGARESAREVVVDLEVRDEPAVKEHAWTPKT